LSDILAFALIRLTLSWKSAARCLHRVGTGRTD
jgi:hypothetical protein